MKLNNALIVVTILLVLCVIALVLIALGVGLGLLLTVMVPSLPMGHAIIAGTIAAVTAALILQRAIDAISAQIDPEDEVPDETIDTLAKELLQHRSGGGRKRPRK